LLQLVRLLAGFETVPLGYYKRHVFFCCNQRDPSEACCNNRGGSEMQAYAMQRIKELGLSGKGKVRVNKAGCMDRCDEGPVVVLYPDAVWYTYVDRHDVDEIIDSHVVHGRVVERLKI
jgi:(2Fe-2S) ferredoxin